MKGLALRFYFLLAKVLAKVLCICLLTFHTCNNLSVKLSFCFSRTEYVPQKFVAFLIPTITPNK